MSHATSHGGSGAGVQTSVRSFVLTPFRIEYVCPPRASGNVGEVVGTRGKHPTYIGGRDDSAGSCQHFANELWDAGADSDVESMLLR